MAIPLREAYHRYFLWPSWLKLLLLIPPVVYANYECWHFYEDAFDSIRAWQGRALGMWSPKLTLLLVILLGVLVSFGVAFPVVFLICLGIAATGSESEPGPEDEGKEADRDFG